MAGCKYYHYFVEGEDEEKVLEVLKSQMRLIVPGKIERFNVVEKKHCKGDCQLCEKDRTKIWDQCHYGDA